MDDLPASGRPVDPLDVMSDDVLIDRLSAAPLCDEPAVQDGCGGRLIRAIMEWRRQIELDREDVPGLSKMGLMASDEANAWRIL